MRKLLTFLIALGAVVFAIASPCSAQMTTTGAGSTFKSPVPWTPAQLTGLIAWYKADNDSTNVFSDVGCTTPQTTNGGNVLCWKDRSGVGRNITNGSGSGRPTYTLAGLNGKPTITFVAASSQYLGMGTGTAMGTGTSGSGFAIGTMNTGTNSFGRLVTYAPPAAGDGTTGGFIYVFRATATNAIEATKGPTVVTAAGAAVSLATETRFGAIANGTTITSYINGAAAGTPGSGSNSFISGGCIFVGTNVGSGCSPSTGGEWDGNVSEIVITNTAMSSTDIANLDAYLAARW
jgi:hypothetical protein